MTPAQVKNRIVKAVIQIQENSGREVPYKITGQTKPIGDLEGFDSLNGLELSVILAPEFGTDPEENLCISADGRHALTVRQIVNRVCGMSTREG